jgi:hypothetical protein
LIIGAKVTTLFSLRDRERERERDRGEKEREVSMD